MITSLLTTVLSVMLSTTASYAAKKTNTLTVVEAKDRKPAQVFSLEECSKKTDIQLAAELLDFIANGGMANSGQTRCAEALRTSSFAPIEPIEGDIVPRIVRINDGDKIEIIKLQELVHELGFKMNTWEVQYIIHAKSKKIKGVLEFSRSRNEEDIKNFGCGYLRAEPDQLFIRKSCEIR